MKVLLQIVAVLPGKDRPEAIEAVVDDPDYTGNGQPSLITRRALFAQVESKLEGAEVKSEPMIFDFDTVAARHLQNRTPAGDKWLERHGLLPK